MFLLSCLGKGNAPHICMAPTHSQLKDNTKRGEKNTLRFLSQRQKKQKQDRNFCFLYVQPFILGQFLGRQSTSSHTCHMSILAFPGNPAWLLSLFFKVSKSKVAPIHVSRGLV